MTYEDIFPNCEGCPISLQCCTIIDGYTACEYKEDDKKRAKFERKLKKPKVITTSNKIRDIRDISPKDKKVFSVEELQSIVGGEASIIQLDDDMVLVVRKVHKTLPINDIATKIYYRIHNIIASTNPIRGDVLLCNSKHVKI